MRAARATLAQRLIHNPESLLVTLTVLNGVLCFTIARYMTFGKV